MKALHRSPQILHINAYTPGSFALTRATADLYSERMIVRDTSLESHAFASSMVKGCLKSFISNSPL